MIENNKHYNNLVLDCFLILKFLYQRNDYENDLEDRKFEEDCYMKSEFDYLYE